MPGERRPKKIKHTSKKHVDSGERLSYSGTNRNKGRHNRGRK